MRIRDIIYFSHCMHNGSVASNRNSKIHSRKNPVKSSENKNAHIAAGLINKLFRPEKLFKNNWIKNSKNKSQIHSSCFWFQIRILLSVAIVHSRYTFWGYADSVPWSMLYSEFLARLISLYFGNSSSLCVRQVVRTPCLQLQFEVYDLRSPNYFFIYLHQTFICFLKVLHKKKIV